MDFSEFFCLVPALQISPQGAEARRIAAKLEAHAAEFLNGHPWMAFHHTLGISGYESYFNHPDEMFYAVSVALPFLSKATAQRASQFLADQLKHSPPFRLDGFARRAGNPRESCDVPLNLRVTGRGKARSAFGIYSFWLYCHCADGAAAARTHWDAVKLRGRALLDAEYKFDVLKKDYSHDEAEKLNGDLAGLLGLVRLARWNEDSATAKQAAARGRQLLELRINLERVNPRIVEKTGSATKQLHNFKLARYSDLIPEIGEALRKLTDGAAATHLKTFREERTGWHLAFGDRLIGGENYTNPPHFVRSIFAGSVLVEQLPADQIMAFVDVPWCKGDFYFMEQCALALWTAAGRPWKKL